MVEARRPGRGGPSRGRGGAADPRSRADQRGLSLSVWTAVAMPAFVIAVGLGVDFSGHAAAEQEAREIAAQAARAATHAVVLTDDGPRLDRAAAARAGRDFAAAAGLPATVALDGLTATVTVEGSYDTLFLGLIGVRSIDVRASAGATAVSTVDGEQA